MRHEACRNHLGYFKIQESLRSKNLTEYYLYKGIFLYTTIFIHSTEDIQALGKTNH